MDIASKVKLEKAGLTATDIIKRPLNKAIEEALHFINTHDTNDEKFDYEPVMDKYLKHRGANKGSLTLLIEKVATTLKYDKKKMTDLYDDVFQVLSDAIHKVFE
jgi:hypothetical protein